MVKETKLYDSLGKFVSAGNPSSALCSFPAQPSIVQCSGNKPHGQPANMGE